MDKETIIIMMDKETIIIIRLGKTIIFDLHVILVFLCDVLATLAESSGIYLSLKMADGPAGFHFDELNKIRVLEPEISQQTQELKEECKEFVGSKWGCFMNEFLRFFLDVLALVKYEFSVYGQL